MIFLCFVFQKSETVCMLFVRCLVAIFVVAAVDVVVIITVPLLPFVCAIFEIVHLSGVFDEMLNCLYLVSIF